MITINLQRLELRIVADPESLAAIVETALAGLRSDVAQLRTEVRDLKGATMTAFERLTQEVTETRGVITSLKTLIEKLAEYIRANSNDPAKLEALADSLNAGQEEAMAAIAANPVPGEVIGEPEPGGGSGEPEPGGGSGEPEPGGGSGEPETT